MTMSTAPIDDGFLDIADHDSYIGGVPHESFARLRRDDPVHWTEERDGRGFWSLTRHADIMFANQKSAIFSSAQGIRIEDQTYEEYLARRTFQETDPPEHRLTRRMVNPAFSQKAIAVYEEMIKDLAETIVDKALESPEFDAVEMIAKQLPMLMLGRILGLPEEDLEWLVTKGDALIGNTDPEFTDLVVDKMDSEAYRFMPFRSPAGVELYDYAEQILRGDKPVDGDGVLARVLAANQSDGVMEDRDFKNFFCLLMAAGNDTTRYSIAMALYQLTANSALLGQLKTGDYWKTAPDEFIRFASPTMHFRRTATSDIELGGKLIKAGDKVVLWFVSGNRDETIFANPNEIMLGRDPNPHVAFGQGGPHFCLGIWLARLEVKVILQVLASRLSSIEAIAEPTWTRSNFICGVKHLQVRASR
ncbi:cytochrome P450 [Alphaproteobacteria bacterium]|nr:cytochrome P450 [Alphaproteobacteria bacterium]